MKKSIIQFIRSTENLEKVTEFSLDFAGKLNHDLKLLLVIESRQGYFYPMTSPLRADLTTIEFDRILEQRRQEEEKNLKAFVNEKNKTGKDVKFSYSIESGASDLVMIQYSKKEGYDFMIINELQEPENGFIFNTYLSIVEKAECPVLKIPENYTNTEGIEKIIYATDYKEEDIPTLKKVTKIASALSSSITALHITDSVDLEEKLLSHGFEKSIMDKIDYNNFAMKLHNHDDVVNGILNFANEGNYGMIVLLKENRNFFQKIFSKSESNKIISESDYPVLIYHE